MVHRFLAVFALCAATVLPTAATPQSAPASSPYQEPTADFPYIQWPRAFTPQNTPADQEVGHFLFWDGKALQDVEGRTFLVTLVAAEGQSSFNEYLIRKTVEKQVAIMGGLKLASGRIPPSVIAEMTSVDKQSLSAGLGDIYNDPVQVWRVHLPRRDIWVQYTDNSAEASIAIVETSSQ